MSRPVVKTGGKKRRVSVGPGYCAQRTKTYVGKHRGRFPLCLSKGSGDGSLHLRPRSLDRRGLDFVVRPKARATHLRRHRRCRWRRLAGQSGFRLAMDNFADPQTGVAPRLARSRNVRSRCRCSMCPAIHISSRSWLRSSSTHEPSDPPPKVVLSFLGDNGTGDRSAF